MEDKLKEIKARCDAANIKNEPIAPTTVSYIGSNKEHRIATFPEGLKIHIPMARELTAIIIRTKATADLALQSKFEKFRLLRDFVGIWSQEEGSIECEIDTLGEQGFPVRQAIRKLLTNTDAETDSEQPSSPIPSPKRIEFRFNGESATASIGLSTINQAFLNKEIIGRVRHNERPRSVSFQLQGVSVSTHDQAQSLIEKAANSALFKMDLKFRTPIQIRRRITKPTTTTQRKIDTASLSNLSISQQYDSDPMSLYWYGRSAGRLPLLAFLAFYQVLEFYFPRFSHAETARHVKQLLKDPRFNPDDDTAVAKLISRAQNLSLGRASELAQLQATLRECTSSEDLLDFIQNDPDRLAYYTSKDKPWKRVADIHLSPQSSDLVSDVARRIYRIRCRIVHTKGEDKEVELLLPFSREAQVLSHDIALAEFLAAQALISSSSPIALRASVPADEESS